MKKKKTATAEKKYTVWNKIPNKPEDCDCIAEPGDICMKIRQCWFLCQRKNDMNNIVCFKQPGKFVDSLSTIRAMFDFAFRLAVQYKIEYVRIAGNPRRYAFVDRLFAGEVMREPELVDGEVVRYLHLSGKVLIKLNILRNGRAKK